MDYLYDIAVESGNQSLLIDWNSESGWIQKYAKELNEAERISYIPKDGSGLPVVTVVLDNGKRWIVFARNFGILGTPNQTKIYCIGWQKTIDGESVKQLIWIYPTGAIEFSDQPTLWKLFI